ncbi:PAS domain-containing protein [Rhodobacter sp. NSM]|uniref:PAS domain-containing protein n=1 Tax=Rhodobacter sp. NSM TaxID=3457501 RepID=UPI003FD2B07D
MSTASWPAAGNATAARIRDHDWSRTALGAADGWSPRLKAQIELVADAVHPMYLALCDDLIFIYNDAYGRFLADRHPAAFGQPMREAFPELWPDLGPLCSEVMSGRPQLLENVRFPMPWRIEQPFGWFTFTLMPVRDEAGVVAGFLASTMETTETFRLRDALLERQRRREFLVKMSDALRPLADADEACSVACRLLGQFLGASRVYYLEYDAADDCGIVINDYREQGLSSLVGRHPMDAFRSTYRRIFSGETWVVTDVGESAVSPEERSYLSQQGVSAWVDVPLVKDGSLDAALCVVQAVPRDWADGETAVIEETAERLWHAIRRARAEAALRESEWRFHQFADNTGDTLWILNTGTGRLEFLNPAFETMWGEGRDRVMSDIGRWAELLHPEDRESAAQGMSHPLAGEIFQQTYRIVRPGDGAVRYIRDTGFPMPDLRGRVARVGGIAQDVTEQMRAEEALRESEERLRSAIEVGGLGLWDWNMVTDEVHWSDEHYRMLGHAVGSVTPAYAVWAECLHPDDRAVAEAAVLEARASGQVYEHEFRVVHADGTVRWLSARGRFFYDEAGRARRMVGAVADMTERREMEEHQRVLIAELQHRTMNLMGVVSSLADKTARNCSDIVEFRLKFRNRMQALARAQRLLSRMDEHARVSFDELIRAEILAVEDGQADRVTLEGPAGISLRSSTVQTLAIALHELAANAVTFGALGQPKGHLSIRWSFQPAQEGGEPWLHIDWSESGVTMPPEAAADCPTGQGRELIEHALPFQLSARTSFGFGPDGVRCTISIPVSGRTDGLPGADPA